MKHLTGMDRSKRLDRTYIEALGLMGDLKTMYDKAAIVVEELIHNVAARVEWKIQAAAQKPHQPIALTNEVAELERLSRIVATLQDSRMNDYRNPDAGAGAREICRILELARREYGGNEQGINKAHDGADVKEAPEGASEKDGGEGDKIRQIPTPEGGPDAPSTDSHRRACLRGK